MPVGSGSPPRRALFVSPHLDDAALSAGASIADLTLARAEVEILTVFAGTPSGELSPVADRLHRAWRVPRVAEALQLRRAEDLAAASVLSARARHGGFLEAIYRRRRDGNWLCERERSVFEVPADEEPDLRRRVAEYVREALARFRPDRVFTCAGVGGHVDHAIVREAVCEIVARDTTLLLWEDIPYALVRPGEPTAARDVRVEASPGAWDLKWDAIRCYPTQTRVLWGRRGDWPEILRRHAVSRGGGRPAERFWAPSRQRRPLHPSDH